MFFGVGGGEVGPHALLPRLVRACCEGKASRGLKKDRMHDATELVKAKNPSQQNIAQAMSRVTNICMKANTKYVQKIDNFKYFFTMHI